MAKATVKKNAAVETAEKGRKATAEDNARAIEVLKDIQENGGYRRNTKYSWYMMKRFRDRGLVELKETEKTAKKGKNPMLYVVSGKGRSLLGAAKAAEARKSRSKSTKQESERATA